MVFKMNHKNVVAIMGSPHISGNVAEAVKALEQGAVTAGHTFTTHILSKLQIKNCFGCRKCIENGGICVIDDDMRYVFEEIKNADTVIIASPIYICQVNGLTKTFLDRLYPLTDVRHKPRFGTRNLIMLYTYGAPVPMIFHRYIRYTGKSLKAMGLLIKRNIVIHGCTTIDKVKYNQKIKKKLFQFGRNL